MSRARTIGVLLFGGIILLIIFLRSFVDLYLDVLWFDHLGYLQVFLKRLYTRVALFGVGFLVSAVFLFLNGLLALRLAPKEIVLAVDDIRISFPTLQKIQKLLVATGSVVLGLIFGGVVTARWLDVLMYLHRQPFGVDDPIFGRDVGFYVFQYPIYMLVNTWLLWLLALALGLSGVIYFLGGSFFSRIRELRAGPKTHLSILGAAILLLVSWRFWLQRFDLLFSTSGAVFGAGYTDLHAKLPAYWILLVITAVAALAMLLASLRRGWKLVVLSAAAFIVSLILIAGVYPGLVQKFVVEPNELDKERPYIKHNIRFTRLAYDLDKIQERSFVPSGKLTLDELGKYEATIRNVRLWDWRPLHATYSQLQEIRLYYDFHDIDVDRYRLGRYYQQVMLSARELNYDQIPSQARTWVNIHLKYTHGYGLCMSPVNRVSPEGLPHFFIKDIPPKVEVDLAFLRPAIYYGEETTEYVLVRTATEEFDYPVGERNQFTSYEGSGGVPISPWLRRLAFAYKFGSSKLLLTGYLTPESRIMYRREIGERMRTIAPFLRFEGDPYPVLFQGRIVWLEDGYTTTDRFPYSERYGDSFNYIRNSVKVVVDAYNGDVSFFVAEPEDPIVRCLGEIFPGLFKPLSEMPEDLRRHLRYPVGLFYTQARLYATYHMQDPQVFYNREDVWEIPRELYAGTEQLMEPYYVVMQLPGEEEPEYILMLPFTPKQKDNMIAWLAARCDPPYYGQMVAFLLPKQQLVFGPRQIEARIDQDPDISRLLTLWSQRGSQVIRGNLLAIPIDDDLLYVEPIYLRAETGELPELKRVVVASGNRIVMRETLEDALNVVLGGKPPEEGPGPSAAPTETVVPVGTTEELASEALRLYEEAMDRLRVGDWAGYGQRMEKLHQILQRLAEMGASP